MHRLREQESIFQLIMTDLGHQLKLTADHLIQVKTCQSAGDGRWVHAKHLRIGDCMLYAAENSKMVAFIRIRDITQVSLFISFFYDGYIFWVVNRGIYAPLTLTGNIFVNSISVSCHCR